MSERESEQGPAEGGAVPVEPGSTPAVEPARPPRRSSARAALWLAGLLILILAGVALSPFWAPQIEPLFPWGENRDEYAALATRLAAVEARPVAPNTGIDAIQSAVSALARRVDQLDSRLAAIEKRPAPPIPDTDAINSALSALAHRVDQLEAAGKPDLGPIRAGMQQLEQRLAAIETQSASRMASETAASKDMQQELSRLGKADGRSRGSSGGARARGTVAEQGRASDRRDVGAAVGTNARGDRAGAAVPDRVRCVHQARSGFRPRRRCPAARRTRSKRRGKPRRSGERLGRAGRPDGGSERTRR